MAEKLNELARRRADLVAEVDKALDQVLKQVVTVDEVKRALACIHEVCKLPAPLRQLRYEG